MIRDITTLVFDLGGVLMDLDKKACIQAFRAIGFTDIDQYLSDYAQKGIFMELEQGKISEREFYEGIREHIGQPVPDQIIREAFQKLFVGIPDYKLEMLWVLKQHYYMILLSNTNPIMMNHTKSTYFADDGMQITDYFNELYLSYEMKITKPNPVIFKKMIQESGIHPQNSFYLDDSPKNLEAAIPFGFHTYLVKPHEDLRPLFKDPSDPLFSQEL